MAGRSRRSGSRGGNGRLLPVLPIGEHVVFPDSMAPLVVTREQSRRLMEHVAEEDLHVVLLAARDDVELPDADQPVGTDVLHEVGTEAVVHRVMSGDDGTVRVLVQGLRRVRIDRWAGDQPFLTAWVEVVPDSGTRRTREVAALVRELTEAYTEVVELAPYLPDELVPVARGLDAPAELCHLVASTLRTQLADKQELLETVDLRQRLRGTLALATRELEMLRLGSRIRNEVQTEITGSQREHYLRQWMRQIQEELGEADGGNDELRRQLDAAALPELARRAADKELRRLERTPEHAAEHGVIRSYLEWLAELPWAQESTDDLDLDHARGVLDRDHHGLDRVKERILDFLAVSQLTDTLGGPIICFVGPPGVGKTSLGRSIAEALGRSFQRISVGGMRDESEIRGHRRTYVGAMPGAIVRSMRDAGTRNPVVMIDEIDKMGADWRGDPASAMLEVLDPEQNAGFRDHYLDVPFDLSGTLFICTANRIDTIPAALRDRMEVIPIEGYTEADKLQIARRHLLPRQRRAHGLRASQLKLPARSLRLLVDGYTREPGVRELDRQLAATCRKAARRIAELPPTERRSTVVEVGEDELVEWLGPARFLRDERREDASPGITAGLAVTAAGGDVLYVEAVAMPGSGRRQVTGQVGEVMQESAEAAVSWLRSHAALLGDGPDDFFSGSDLHVHVPAGAIPKDGPSAGITIATALASTYWDIPVRDDVAMTGEITLTGQVLPVGGIRDKVLAAHRAGFREVVLPHGNEPDLAEIPARLLRGVTVHIVDHVEQVLRVAFDPARWPAGLDTPRGGSESLPRSRRPAAAGQRR